MRKQKNSQKHVFFLAVIFTALLPTTSLADMSGGTFNARNEVVVPLVGQMDGSGYHANISIVPVAGVVTGTGFSVSVGYPVVATPSSSSSSSGGGGFVPPAAPTPTPTPTPTPEPEEEKPKVHNIYNVQTRFVGPGSASITFDTDAPAKTFMSYMGGGQANNTTPESVGVFAHTITLSGLKSSTTYTFTISAEFSDGQKIVFQNNTYTFTTSSAPEDPKEVKTVKDKELTPTDKPSQPSNPSNPGTDSGTTPTGPQSTLPDPSNVMYTYSETDNPVLSWKKPDDPRVSQIVIARSTVNFPQKPSEGEIVYSGTVEAFTDASALGSQEYYYTVFSIDSSGNSSLGVPIKTTPKEKEIKKEEVPLEQTSEESAEPTLKEFIEETLPAAETSSKVVGVVGAAGYAAAAASNMFALSAASGLAEMKLMILRLWSDFLSLIYLRRRRRVWGIVYDSETKQPLDPVVLELKNPETGAVIETAVT
ncbi:MAG TPA: hypothetical protein VEA59_06015, partial [Patescibacteria group bacterium]|nr:hypothetical protein [Patescibacteria group bacterium]